MPRIEVAGDICLRIPRPAQGCRTAADDISCVMTVSLSVYLSVCKSRLPMDIHEILYLCIFLKNCREISRFIKNRQE